MSNLRLGECWCLLQGICHVSQAESGLKVQERPLVPDKNLGGSGWLTALRLASRKLRHFIHFSDSPTTNRSGFG
jgi:hypothetical protein